MAEPNILALPNRSPSIPLDLLETLGQRLAVREGNLWGTLSWQQRQGYVWAAEQQINTAIEVLADIDGHRRSAPRTIADMAQLRMILEIEARWLERAAAHVRNLGIQMEAGMGVTSP
jgi:hypothetical protein